MTVTYKGNQTSGAALTADNFAEQRHVKDAVAIMGLQKERTPPMPKGERWLPIPGYEGRYEVSDLGRVRSFVYRKPRIMKPALQGSGYLRIHLGEDNQVCIHRLVLSAFVRQPYSIEVGNHKNGIKTDNRLSNLEWCTPRENEAHASRNGLKANGTRHGMAKLSERDVDEIRRLRSIGVMRKIVAAQFSISEAHVSRIISKHYWGRQQ